MLGEGLWWELWAVADFNVLEGLNDEGLRHIDCNVWVDSVATGNDLRGSVLFKETIIVVLVVAGRVFFSDFSE